MKTFIILILAILGVARSSAYGDEPQGYRVTLPQARIGRLDLYAGEYKLLVHRDEPRVQILEITTGTMVDLAGKVEDAESKFKRTEVHSQDIRGVRQIMEIRIGGTRIRLNFRKAS
jgi:hypothetical protein